MKIKEKKPNKSEIVNLKSKICSALFLSTTFLIGVSGCVMPFTKDTSSQVNKTLSFERLLVNPESHVGEVIVAGGRILETNPFEGSTEMIILEQPLTFDYSPLEGDQTHGRFILKAKGFLDPAVYSPGRKITVAAKVMGTQSRVVGEKEYDYPVFEALEIRLWPAKPDIADYPLPYSYWRDPFWEPWGPYWELLYYPCPNPHCW